MKRLLLTLLSCLMLLCAPMSSLAGEGEARQPITPGEDLLARFSARPYRFDSFVAWKDSLAFTDGTRLFTLMDGKAYVAQLGRLLPRQKVEGYATLSLILGESGLYLLRTLTGELFEITLASGGLAAGAPLYLQEWEDYQYDEEGFYLRADAPEHYAISQGTLYALEEDGSISAFDLNTGRKSATWMDKVLWMAPYHNGKLLLLRWQENSAEGAARPAQIATANVESGEAWTIRALQAEEDDVLPPLGAAFDALSNTLYAVLGDTVYRYEDMGEGQPAAQVPYDDSMMGLKFAALLGGILGFAGWQDVHLVQADPQLYQNRVPLKIRVSDMNAQGVNRAASRVPGITAAVDEEGLSQQTLAEMMVLRDDTYDLFWLNLAQADFAALMEKGYALKLNTSQKLIENHVQLVPIVQQTVSKNGEVFAVPVSAYATVCLREERFIGPNGQMPVNSLDDLIDFLERWPMDFASQYPDMAPVSSENIRRGMYEMVLRLYTDAYFGAGRELSFDTPQLRQLLTRLSALDWAALGGVDSDYLSPVFFDNEWMLYISLMDGDGRDNLTYLPFIPDTAPDLAAALPLHVSVVFINPFSKHPNEAVRFLEALVDLVDENSKLMLYDKDAAAVENPQYRQTLEDHLMRVEEIKQEAAAARGAEKAELEASALRVASYYDELAETARWLISPDQMAAWLEFSRHAFVQQLTPERQGALAAFEILSRLADGQMGLEEFIKEAQGRLRLVREENR